MLPKVKHIKSLFQHLITYPLAKALVVAFALSLLNLLKPRLEDLNSLHIFVVTFLIAWVGYFFSYSLRSKKYHFYEEGQFNSINSQNVRIIGVKKSNPPFGHSIEFEVLFFNELDTVPTLEISQIKASAGAVVDSYSVLYCDKKRATIAIDVGVSPGLSPEKSLQIINYKADATDNSVPLWFLKIYRKFPGLRV